MQNDERTAIGLLSALQFPLATNVDLKLNQESQASQKSAGGKFGNFHLELAAIASGSRPTQKIF